MSKAAAPPDAEMGRSGAAHRLQEGERFERFVVDRFLGGGYHGDVYVVRDGNELSALKIMRARGALAPEQKQRFCDEGAIFGRLQHRNLVSILETGVTEEDRCWTRMELLLGGTLREELEQGSRITLPTAIRYLRHALAGAHELHSFGIIHRDLKPENMMLLRDVDLLPVLKLVDFNTAVFLQEDPQRLSAGGSGTPAYMAPEQLRWNGARLGPPTDVYAICLVGWEMLAGARPMVDTTNAPRLSRGQAPTSLVSSQGSFGIPHAMADMLAKGLAPSPSDRYPTAASAAFALAEVQRLYLGRSSGSREDVEAQEGRRASAALVTPRQSVSSALLKASVASDDERDTPARSTVPGAPPEELLNRGLSTGANDPRDARPTSPERSAPCAGLHWERAPGGSEDEGNRPFPGAELATLPDLCPRPILPSSPPLAPTPPSTSAPFAPLPELLVQLTTLPPLNPALLPSSFRPPEPSAPLTAVVVAPAPRTAQRRPRPPLSAIQVLGFGVFMLGLALFALAAWIGFGRAHVHYSPPWLPGGEAASRPGSAR